MSSIINVAHINVRDTGAIFTDNSEHVSPCMAARILMPISNEPNKLSEFRAVNVLENALKGRK